MTQDVTEAVPDGMEEVARACRELREKRGKETRRAFGARVGVSSVQVWHWERCYLPKHPRPNDTHREALHILYGIAPWRWRSRQEQQALNDLRASVAEREQAAIGGGSEAA